MLTNVFILYVKTRIIKLNSKIYDKSFGKKKNGDGRWDDRRSKQIGSVFLVGSPQ